MKKEQALRKFFLLGIAEENGMLPNEEIFEDDIIVISDTQCLWTVDQGIGGKLSSAWVLNNSHANRKPKMVLIGMEDE